MEKVVKEVPDKLNAVWTTHQRSRNIFLFFFPPEHLVWIAVNKRECKGFEGN